MSKYKLSPNVRWVVDRFSVTLTDHQGATRTLGYPEAAVWDLVSRGYTFDKVVSMITHIAALDHAAADALVRATLEGWAQAGFVEAA